MKRYSLLAKIASHLVLFGHYLPCNRVAALGYALLLLASLIDWWGSRKDGV